MILHIYNDNLFTTIYPYLFLLFSHFGILFSPSFSYSSGYETFYILQSLIQFHYNLPVILRRYKKLYSAPKKKCCINYNQTDYSNTAIFGTKYDFFLPPYQLTFSFLTFVQAEMFFTLILMNILSLNYCIVTILRQKNCLIFHTQHTYIQKVITELQTTFQNKKKTCFNKICLLSKVYLIYICVYIYIILQRYSKTLLHQRHSVQRQPFADALQNRFSWKICKINRKTPVLESLFNQETPSKKVFSYIYMIFAKFSRTPCNIDLYAIKIALG